MNKLNDQLSEVINKYKSGIAFTLTEDRLHNKTAFCTINGFPQDIITAIISSVTDNEDNDSVQYLRSILYQSTIAVMMSDIELSREFFANLNSAIAERGDDKAIIIKLNQPK